MHQKVDNIYRYVMGLYINLIFCIHVLFENEMHYFHFKKTERKKKNRLPLCPCTSI